MILHDALKRLHDQLNRRVRQAQAAGQDKKAQALRRRLHMVSGLIGHITHAENRRLEALRRLYDPTGSSFMGDA